MGGRRTISCTHAFDEGDQVLTADGQLRTVTGLDWTTTFEGDAYDLTIDGLHTFYVTVGNDEVLVHNCVANANFAQRTFRERFSTNPRSPVSGRTIDDVASSIRDGSFDPNDLQVQYAERGGHTLILNTRSAQALARAGVPRSAWNAVDVTGDPGAEARLSAQLARSGLSDAGIAVPQSWG